MPRHQQQLTMSGTALVVGATGRIGSAVVRELASAGLRVAIHCRTSAEAAEVLRRSVSSPSNHVVFQRDLTSRGGVDDLYTEVSQVLGAPEVMVNAMHCQFTPRAVADGCWDEDWAPHVEAMRVHVELCQRAAVAMSERGYGRIVLISGALAARPLVGCGPYAAIKAGLHGFHRVLAHEVGAAGVTVNAVAPCRVEPDDERSATDDPQSWEQLNGGVESGSALPRDPVASEVASAVSFLVSAAAGTMTGQVLYLSRGQVMVG